MSQLFYNGVELKICRVNPGTGILSVYDESGTDLLYHHWRIDVNAVVSNWATASDPTLGNNAFSAPAPVQNPPGDLGPVSVSKLHSLLMAPRKQLLWTVGEAPGGGSVILQSPPTVNAPGQVVALSDANNGPKPVGLKILSIQGIKTVLVNYVVETYMLPCTNPPSPLVSHRWEQSETWDRSYYSTRTTRGTAIFRTDLLNLPGGTLQPDFLRDSISHPVPTGFQRIDGSGFTISKNGRELNYVLVDEEQTIPLNKRWGITEIEGTYTQEINWLGKFMPDRDETFNFRVRGQKNISPRQVANALLQAIGSFINMTNVVPQISSGRLRLGLAEWWGELEFTIRTSANFGASIGNFIYSIFNAGSLSGLGQYQVPGAVLAPTWGQLAAPPGESSIAPPNSNGMRGTNTFIVVAQVLSLPCATPAAPALGLAYDS